MRRGSQGVRGLRRAGLVGWLLLLVGPTPGAVGSCSGDNAELERRADLRDYCRQREELVCVRGALRRQYTDAERDDCRRDAIERCESRFWLPSCRPAVRDTEACLTALRLVETLDRRVGDIAECNTNALACAETADVSSAGSAADAGAM